MTIEPGRQYHSNPGHIPENLWKAVEETASPSDKQLLKSRRTADDVVKRILQGPDVWKKAGKELHIDHVPAERRNVVDFYKRRNERLMQAFDRLGSPTVWITNNTSDPLEIAVRFEANIFENQELLKRAVEKGDLEAIEVLMEIFHDLGMAIPEDCFFTASNGNDLPALKMLMKGGVKNGTQEKIMSEALDRAVYHGFTEMRDFLLSKGAKLIGWTLDSIVRRNDIQQAKVLLKHPFIDSIPDEKKAEIFWDAVNTKEPNIEIIRLMMHANFPSYVPGKEHILKRPLERIANGERHLQEVVDLVRKYIK